MIPLGIARLLGLGDTAGLYGARLLGVPLLCAFFLLVIRLTRSALPKARLSVMAAAAAVATLNPMLVTMGMSVQNDLLALVLAAAALAVAVTPGGLRRASFAGLLIGLALLTKLTAWPVAPVIVVMLLWRRKPWHALAVFVVAAAASGWWFVRNLMLYGDLTGRRGVAAAGYDFPPAGVHGLRGIGGMFREAVTYLWLPNEYLRNTISAPVPLKVLLVLITVIIVVLAAACWRSAFHPGAVAAVSILAAGAWVVTFVAVQAVPPRLGYCALFGWAALTALALSRMPGRLVAFSVGALLLGLHAWTLLTVASLAAPGLKFL